MRLPEQPGEGRPENEKKGNGGAPKGGEEPLPRSQTPNFPTWEKMPFHHVTAGLLYKGNYLNRSLSAGSDSEQLANISVEELDEIREAFRVLDRDGNGFISKQELGMAMRSLGYMPSEVELAIIMQRLDMDGDGQVDFDEFMTILGPKLVSSEGRDGFLGNTIDSIFWQFDMQRITLEELKHILYHAFRDHLTMKDIENIIINEEESLNETSGNCQTEFEGGKQKAPLHCLPASASPVTFSPNSFGDPSVKICARKRAPFNSRPDGKMDIPVHSQKQNRQTCVRKSLICAFAMAFIISVMLIAANQILRSGME
ncbi:calcium-binding protein 8 isoform X2 [Heterocephalus glaber]|uniref:Calcium-binding protein 8 isoform X2 n=1 Tax=Heterocephalus glaber TaxID=10181 RepID=A0AAX6SMB7_HETGA|nr:calcium-binding protein 8 isoform X2 [Heterocephalus glaber]